MDLLWTIPAILKVAGIFCLILVLIRYKYQLGTALLASALVLGVWFQMPLSAIALTVGTTMIQTKTVMLSAIVVLIMILSRSLDRLNQMKRLLASFQGLVVNDKFNLIVFPALIGLLPMPGGAIFSAPMVEELGNEHHLDPETKSMLNYWFRHVWEFAWPLYPGVLLASSMASVSVWAFVWRTFPLTILSILAGYIFLLRTMKVNASSATGVTNRAQLLRFFKETIPIVIVIIGAISGNLCLAWLQRAIPALSGVPTEIPLVLALMISIAYVWRINKASFDDIRSVLLDKGLLKMIYMIVGIYIFKEMLMASEAVIEISAFLAEQQIPFMLVVIILPLLVGGISGITVAAVGTTFPVLLSLLQTLQLEGLLMPYLILGFSAGFIGVMLSPLHVCLLFTQEFFKADFRILYHRLWKPLTMLMAGALIYVKLLMMIG